MLTLSLIAKLNCFEGNRRAARTVVNFIKYYTCTLTNTRRNIVLRLVTFRIAQRIFFEISPDESRFFARNFNDISREQLPNFNEIRLHSFCTVLYISNVPALRLYRAHGFEIIGFYEVG